MANVKEYIKDSTRVFVVPVEILEQEELSIYEKMVYIVLRSYCNAHKHEAFPSYATIAKMSSMSRRKAIECVQALIQKGLLRKESRFNKKKDKIIPTSNLYTLETPNKTMFHGEVVHSIHQVVHPVHHGSAQDALKNNNLKELSNNGWLEKKYAYEENNLSEEWSLLKSFCVENRINGSECMNLYKVWRTHYNNAPISMVISTLKELINEKIVINKDGWTEKEYKNLIGLFHHRMKFWKEMSVAYEDIEANGGWN